MRYRITIFAALAFCCFAAPAHADECDDVGKLKGTYLERCKSDLNQKCMRDRGSSRAKCIDRVVKNALSSQERDEAKNTAANEAEQAYGMCTSDAYKDACTSLRQYRNDVCEYGKSYPQLAAVGGEGLEGVKKQASQLIERYAAYQKGKAEIPAFLAKYGKCANAPRDYRPSCEFGDHEQKLCAAAEETFKARWLGYIDEFEQTSLATMDEELVKAKKAKSAPTMPHNHFIHYPPTVLKEIQRINDATAWLGVKPARLTELAGKFATKQAEWDTALDALLAKVKCPVRGKKGKLLKVMEEHSRKTKDPSSTMVETVKAFATVGKVRTSREPLKGLTHEDQGGQTCVLQEKNGSQACRIFDVTFRRTKPDRGKWGPWDFYSVGGGQLMSCKNLK